MTTMKDWLEDAPCVATDAVVPEVGDIVRVNLQLSTLGRDLRYFANRGRWGRVVSIDGPGGGYSAWLTLHDIHFFDGRSRVTVAGKQSMFRMPAEEVCLMPSQTLMFPDTRLDE